MHSCGLVPLILGIFIRVTSLALEKSYDCSEASDATLKNVCNDYLLGSADIVVLTQQIKQNITVYIFYAKLCVLKPWVYSAAAIFLCLM